MDNYPDNIRSFDNEPGSPYYTGPEDAEIELEYCDQCDEPVCDSTKPDRVLSHQLGRKAYICDGCTEAAAESAVRDGRML